jgi:hypothetical protein
MRLFRSLGRYWLLGLVSLATLVSLAYRFTTVRTPSLWQSYSQIRDGMTEEEVDALLGEPESCFTAGSFGCCGLSPLSDFGAIQQKGWTYKEAQIKVGFDEHGRVRCKCSSNVGPPLSSLEEIRLFFLDLCDYLARRMPSW